MMGCNIHFKGVIQKIIPYLSLYPLIWSTDSSHLYDNNTMVCLLIPLVLLNKRLPYVQRMDTFIGKQLCHFLFLPPLGVGSCRKEFAPLEAFYSLIVDLILVGRSYPGKQKGCNTSCSAYNMVKEHEYAAIQSDFGRLQAPCRCRYPKTLIVNNIL